VCFLLVVHIAFELPDLVLQVCIFRDQLILISFVFPGVFLDIVSGLGDVVVEIRSLLLALSQVMPGVHDVNFDLVDDLK
jgi:hypothetical protein